MNRYLSYLIRFVRTAFGLAIFAMGVYLTIRGNTGMSPWDTLATGISGRLGITYGMANISISIVILVIDYLMKEPIGFGTIMNAFLIGIFADFYTALNLVPMQDKLLPGVGLLLAGMCCMAVGQFFYMGGCMGCGPRDSFLVGLGKRLAKLPIGVVQTMILIVVLAGGFVLGAKIGIGTAIATFGIGTVMQIIFGFLHFEPRKLVHEDVFETAKKILGKECRRHNR